MTRLPITIRMREFLLTLLFRYTVFALARFCDDRVQGAMTWWLERGPEEEVVISPHMGKINKQH